MPELDALRGLAAIAVVLLHFSTDFRRDYAPNLDPSFSFVWGNYGVHLFFIISGFVILLTAQNSSTARTFAIARFVRLYPAYWVAIIVTTAVLVFMPLPGGLDEARTLRRAVASLTMFQSWFGVGSLDSVYWTLGVELTFYLLVMALLYRRSLDKALAVMTAIVCFAIIEHVTLARYAPDAHQWLRQFQFLDVAYLFTIGILIFKSIDGIKTRHGLILLACFSSPATAHYFPNDPPVDTLVVVVLTLVFYLAVHRKLGWLASRPLMFLGGISYSLYLTHHWLGLTALYYANQWGVDPLLAVVLAIALCIGVATLMTVLVERPCLRRFRSPRRHPRHAVDPTLRS